MPKKIGDLESKERGTGARFNSGKPAMELIPLEALYPAARVFDYGRNKYAEWNWAKGMPWSVPIACMLRHIAAIQSGEDMDPESGELHIGHVLCNALMLAHYYQHCRDMDDRPNELTEQYHTETRPSD